MPLSERRTAPEGETFAAAGLCCDFCGEPAPSLRRIALDRGYDRLQTPHREQYACRPCSEKKERRRLGLERG